MKVTYSKEETNNEKLKKYTYGNTASAIPNTMIEMISKVIYAEWKVLTKHTQQRKGSKNDNPLASHPHEVDTVYLRPFEYSKEMPII